MYLPLAYVNRYLSSACHRQKTSLTKMQVWWRAKEVGHRVYDAVKNSQE